MASAAPPPPRIMFEPRSIRLSDGRTALLRRAEDRDAEGLIANANRVGAEGVYIMTEHLDATLEHERSWIASYDGESGLLLAAELDGRIVGVSDIARGAFHKSRHTAGLGIALQPEVRGLGLGRAMLEAMIEWAAQRGIRKVTLQVFDTNERAKGLYRRMGFSEEARLSNQVELEGRLVDVVVMSRWLP